MNYEQLILQNNSLNKIVVVLWFFLFCQIMCKLAGCEERLAEC